MKTAETKTTATQARQTQKDPGQPFFNQDGQGGFFSASKHDVQPFFQPHASPFIQTKLSIGKPGDKYEREADAKADEVVRKLSSTDAGPMVTIGGAPASANVAQRKCAACEEEGQISQKEESIQRKPIFESRLDSPLGVGGEPDLQAKFVTPAPPVVQRVVATPEAEEETAVQEEQLQLKPIFESAADPADDNGILQRTCAACEAEEEQVQKADALPSEETRPAAAPPAPDLEARLHQAKGGGSPLPETARSKMEGAFGADFSGVRVHTGSSAVQMNQQLGAQAFAHGQDIYFNAGKFDSQSMAGQQLLAHELTHVVQQNGSVVKPKLQPIQPTGQPNGPQEHDADTENVVQKLAAQAVAATDSTTADYAPASKPVPANHAGGQGGEKSSLEEEAVEEPVSTEETPLQAVLSGNPEPPDGEDGDAAPLGDFSLEKTSLAGNFVQEKGAVTVSQNGHVPLVQRQEAADDAVPPDHLDEFNSDPVAILERINPGRYCRLNCPATADAFENFVRTGRIEAAHCDTDAELRGTIGYDVIGRLSGPFNITPVESRDPSRRDQGLQRFVRLVERQLGSHGDLMVIEAQRTAAQQTGRSGRRLSAYHYFVLVNIRGAVFVVDAFQHVVRPISGFRDYLNHLNVTNLRYVRGGFEARPMDLRVRPKLFSPTSNGPQEKEADAVAEKVARMQVATVADFSNGGLGSSVSPTPVAVQMDSHGEMSAELAEELKRSEEEQKAAISDSEANQTRNQADNEAQEAELSAQEEVPEALPEALPPMPEEAQEASETRTAEPTPQNADRAPDPLAAPEEPLGPAGQQLASESENACQDAADKSQELADNEQAHDDASEKVEQSEGSVEHPTEEGQSQSNAEQVGTMEKTPGPEADPGAAKAELDKSIEEAVPQTIDEMNKFESGKKGQVVGNQVLAVSASQVGEVKGTYSEIENTPPPAEAEQPVPLPEMEEAPPTPALDLGEGAVPDVAPEQTDFSEYENQADEIYEKEGVTPELKAETEKVTDGEIGEANKERQNLNEKVAGEPDKIQEFAKERQQNVETDLRKEEEQAKAVMEAKRAAELDGAQKEQQKTKSAMELKREEVTNWINTRYETAKTFVDETLKNLEQQSLAQFDAGQKALSTHFERNVKRRVNAWKSDRYSGLFGGVKWLKDKFFGIDDFPEIKEIFSSERENFVKGIDQLIAAISQSNNETIQACRDEIAKANQEIEEYVSQLEPGLQDIGKKAQEETAQKLKALDDKVEEEKKKLQDALCKKREEAIKAIDEKIEAMKEEMSGLLSKLGNLLLGLAKKFFKWSIEKIGGSADRIIAILDKGASVLKALFTDPIGFFVNLGKAVGGGIDRFVSNIVTHLKKGLITWLTGAMGDSGLQLPETFDMKGILSIGLQVMGLTWNVIRSKIVKALGPKGEAIMSKAESAVEVIKRVKEEGPIALWHILKEKAGEFKEKVMEGIRNWTITQIIKKATVKLVSMLNPVGAIIQAIIAIYDVVMFFVENWQRIVDFVNAIFDSISEIALGAIGKAAGFIEKTLGLAVPLMISFLSRFIGLSGIGNAIRKIIETIRKPIEKVMGKVVGFVVKMVKKVFGKGDKKTKKEKEDEKDVKAKVSRELKGALVNGVNNPQQVRTTVDRVYENNKKAGLKSLEVNKDAKKAGQFDIIAVASPEKEVASFALSPPILSFDDIDPDNRRTNPRTWIIAEFNDLSLGRIDNKPGGDHAEQRLIKLIRANWQELPHVTDGQDVLSVEINNSPCGESSENCSTLLFSFTKERNILLRIKAMNLYRGAGHKHEAGSIEGLEKLMNDPNITFEVLEIVDLKPYGIDLDAMLKEGVISSEDKARVEKRIKDRAFKLKKDMEAVDSIKQGK